MTFDLDERIQAQIRAAALRHRLTLGELAVRAFTRELQFLERRPIKRLKKGLRRGRPMRRPSRPTD